MQFLTQRISVQGQVHSHTCCACTHAYTCVPHVYTHVHVCPRTRVQCTLVCAQKYTSTCTYIHICEHIYIYTHSHIGVNVYTCRHMLYIHVQPTCVRVGTHTHACTDVCAYTNTCVQTPNTCTLQYMHANTHLCGHTCTRAHTHSPEDALRVQEVPFVERSG